MRTKKIDENLNVRLRESLEKYKKIESPAAGLLPVDNIYGRPPYFAFRFKDGTYDDYNKIAKILDEFTGQLQWTITSKDGYRNHLIQPKELEQLNDRVGNSIHRLTETLGLRIYDLCDKAVADIEPLCDWIEMKLL